MNKRKDERIRNGFCFGVFNRENLPLGHPLPVDGCLIMQCTSGNASFSINSKRFGMAPDDVGFVVFDMVAVPAMATADFEARYLNIRFEEAQDIFFLVTSNRFWDFIYKLPVFTLPAELRGPLGEWFALVEWMGCSGPAAIREKVMRNEAENFMLNMMAQVENRLGMLGANPAKNRAWTLINDFIGLLDRHYASHHDVAFYAGCLNVTPNYLNILSRRFVGTTAKEQINLQICLVAKMLLETTNLSVKQIAERLHYDDPSYLCRIFRKQTGMSPICYRNKNRFGRSVADAAEEGWARKNESEDL